MKSLIRLFKAVEIKSKNKKNPSKDLLEQTVKRGFIFSPLVVGNYSDKELNELIKVIEEEIGLTAEQMTNSFHKSWKKVKETSIEQLVIEQIIHYFTTYGFEDMGIYNNDSVYIPSEKLEIPELEEGIKLTVINGYTKKELKEKLLSLLQSGIALNEDTINDVVEVSIHVELGEKEINNIKNKEVKIALYDYLDLFPENPIEFLRYAIYKSIGKTLLIKDEETITEIGSKTNHGITTLFIKYKRKYGFERLAEIFHRFKPIFLAFRTNTSMKYHTNKIRKLAKKYHKPMKEDYLNSVTAKIKNKEKIDENKLKEELGKVNTFRKIRLAYALKFRTKEVDSILYRIRNGKGYATDFSFTGKEASRKALNTVLESIAEDTKKNVKGKKIYIPENMVYSLPATEKQFTGYFPSGTYVTIPKDMVFGIYWEDVKDVRIDIDLSMINASEKMGWDSSYRTEDGGILFSGDLTSAPKPKGSSELYYVKRQKLDAHIIFANYYNYEEETEVPLDIFVAKEEVKNLSKNYMINPNNVIAIAKTKITQKQKILGLLVTTTSNCRFYFAETYLGRDITSSDSKFAENSRKYLFDFYKDAISLNEILIKAGGKLVKEKDKCDIDLSPENLQKDTIINLIK